MDDKLEVVKEKGVVLNRGTIEDWSSDREDGLLKKRYNYAQRLISEQLRGSPDFEAKFGELLKSKSSPKE